MSKAKAFVLLSGGLDSSTVLYVAAQDMGGPGQVVGVSVKYKQRHENAEVPFAARVAGALGCEHRVVELNIPKGGLTDPDLEIPPVDYADIKGVSPTYVPFRNGLMIATLTGLAHAEGGKGSAVYGGWHAEDARGGAYPDCTLEFIGAMAAATEKGTYGEVQLRAPFICSSKGDIVRKGTELGVPYEKTWSCYEGGILHCGVCPTCRARKTAFMQAGVSDPTRYMSDLTPEQLKALDDDIPF